MITAYQLPPLRIMTAGHVDDGKSTLLGRMLADSNALYDDHLADIVKLSQLKSEATDYSLAFDGLADERSQGITIDVGYRYFRSRKRVMILADAPGHEEYTGNAAAAAANSDVCLLLVDATRGLSKQSLRHMTLANLFAIKHIIVAVNKIDLLDYSLELYEIRAAEIKAVLAQFSFETAKIIPVSAREGDNIVFKSKNTPYYNDLSLLELLETLDLAIKSNNGSTRLAIQWVNRYSSQFRGYAGTLTSGNLKKSAELINCRSNVTVQIKDIIKDFTSVEEATAGEAVTLTFEEEADAVRGDVFISKHTPPIFTDRFLITILNCQEPPIAIGNHYLLRFGMNLVSITVVDIVHRQNFDVNDDRQTKTLLRNDIGTISVIATKAVPIETDSEQNSHEKVLLVDRNNNMTIAIGMIAQESKGDKRSFGSLLKLTPELRAAQKNQTPKVIWFTGLSGSGKTTIANALEAQFYLEEKHSFILDGDLVRNGLSSDLGFSAKDRVENIRRVAEVAKMMCDAGLIVMVCLISPFESDRQIAKALIGEERFVEVYVNTSLEICKERDPKGLYEQVSLGKIKGFTGIDSPYEAPAKPDIILNAGKEKIPDMIKAIQNHLNSIN